MTLYTYSVIAGFFAVLILDFILRTKVIRPNARFFYTTIVFVIFQLIFDNYFTLQGLWVFNQSETLEIFVPFIPIENLLFGVVLLWGTLILYTKMIQRSRSP